MCGLVGVAGYISQKEENVFKRLLELDTIRGPHSTGVLAVDAGGNTEIVKKVGTPWDLYQYKQFDDLLRASLCVLMGHNRWATKGKINQINAHPFEHGHIIGAHNGTLRGQYLLPDYKQFEVDSDNIFYSMSVLGVDETISKTCGAFALTWYDAEQETMNFIRNDERPLYICETEDKRTVYWASEPWMLEVTLGLAGVKYRDIYQPKPGQLFTYPIELAYAPKAFQDVKERRVKLHEFPVYNSAKTSSAANTGTSVPAGKAVDLIKEAGVAVKKLEQASGLVRQGEVEFFVSSLETSKATGQQWLSCGATQDNCEVELRLYLTDQDVLESMLRSVHLFTATVRGYCTAAGETYCTLDPRTVVELMAVEQNDEPEEELVVVYGGEIKTEEEYEELVSCGCGNCKVIPTIEESEDIVWLDKFNFICGDCKELPVVDEFLKNAKNINYKH